MALRLVEEGLTHAAMFTADGEVVHAAEVLHKQPILVQRGSFRPVTRATVNMLDCACTHFSREPRVQEQSFVVLLEMTLRHLATGRGIEPGDFLDRVDLLGTLGRTVLISDFAEYHRLAAYLSRSTRKMVGIALGARKLEGLFAESQYAELEGGILESFGRLFKNDLKLYVYPYLDAATERLVGIDEVAVPGHLRHLWAHLRENRLVEGLENVDSSCLPVFAREVLARIGRGDPSWEPMVPAQVAQAIRARRLFGYRP
jgi:hypothetical protein